MYLKCTNIKKKYFEIRDKKKGRKSDEEEKSKETIRKSRK